MEPVALSALALVAVVGVVAIVLAIVNRHSMRWRFGVFYERDDLPESQHPIQSHGHEPHDDQDHGGHPDPPHQ